MGERGTIKDKIAWTIIFGGTTLAQFIAFKAAIIAGLVSPMQAAAVQRNMSSSISRARNNMWSDYKNSGDLFESIRDNL